MSTAGHAPLTPRPARRLGPTSQAQASRDPEPCGAHPAPRPLGCPLPIICAIAFKLVPRVKSLSPTRTGDELSRRLGRLVLAASAAPSAAPSSWLVLHDNRMNE